MAKFTQAQKNKMRANTRKIGVGGAASLVKNVAKRVLPKIAKKAGPKIRHFMDYKGKGIDLTAKRKGLKW